MKATDVMGNSHADSTFVKVDKTPPSVSVDYDTALERNIKNGPYNYSSKKVRTNIQFKYDTQL